MVFDEIRKRFEFELAIGIFKHPFELHEDSKNYFYAFKVYNPIDLQFFENILVGLGYTYSKAAIQIPIKKIFVLPNGINDCYRI